MSPGVTLQAVVTGLANGTVYGLVGMGFSLVYGLTRVLPFAHGDLVAGSVAAAVVAVLGSTPTVTSPSGLDSVGLVALALAAGVMLSIATYALVVRPALHARTSNGSMTWIGGGIVAGLLIRQGLVTIFPRDATAVPDPMRLGAFVASGVVHLPGGGVVPSRLLGVLVLGLLAGFVVEALLVGTLLGRAMRAVADDPQAAALSGIRTGRVLLIAFAVAGLLAGLAGLLAVPGRSLTADTGVLLGLKAIAGALLWRLGSPLAALAGGITVGVLESLAVTSNVLGPSYADVLALGILVVVLASRPEGLRASGAVVVE